MIELLDRAGADKVLALGRNAGVAARLEVFYYPIVSRHSEQCAKRPISAALTIAYSRSRYSPLAAADSVLDALLSLRLALVRSVYFWPTH